MSSKIISNDYLLKLSDFAMKLSGNYMTDLDKTYLKEKLITFAKKRGWKFYVDWKVNFNNPKADIVLPYHDIVITFKNDIYRTDYDVFKVFDKHSLLILLRYLDSIVDYVRCPICGQYEGNLSNHFKLNKKCDRDYKMYVLKLRNEFILFREKNKIEVDSIKVIMDGRY